MSESQHDNILWAAILNLTQVWSAIMDTYPKKISAIFRDEMEMEIAITALKEQTVGLQDVSVQGSPADFQNKLGVSYISPESTQTLKEPPKTEPFLQDDFGWVIGFSFSVPLFIGIIIGVFVIGDVNSMSDNILFGLLGAVAGSAVGYLLANFIKSIHDKKIRKQENKGGYVLWVTVRDKEQENHVIELLKKYNGVNIKVALSG